MSRFDGASAIGIALILMVMAIGGIAGFLIFSLFFWVISSPWWIAMIFASVPAIVIALWWFRS